MTRPDEPATLPEENVRPSGVRSDERRRLLRGSLAAGPVILTIVSRPVLGQPQATGSHIGCSLTTDGCTSLHRNAVLQPKAPKTPNWNQNNWNQNDWSQNNWNQNNSNQNSSNQNNWNPNQGKWNQGKP